MRAAALAVLATAALPAQDFSQRGFLEWRGLAFPQAAFNDSAHGVAALLFRYEASYKPSPGWRLAAGLDARTDTHREVERRFGLSWRDRERQRPALSVRRASVAYSRRGLTLELGKQFIRWGKADILNPTDRFAPRDFLAVVDTDFLAVTAGRLAIGAQQNTVELVFAPWFTPSRIPLINRRWAPLPPSVQVRELEAKLPARAQYGVRWNHVGRGLEYSLSFYDGYNHLPLFDVRPVSLGYPVRVLAQRFYPHLRMYGADLAWPLGWVTLKGETAWLRSRTPQADEYLLYVIQAERQAGEWSLVGGYAGQHTTRARQALGFAPDRGLARAFLGRASYTIDANRSLATEGAVRQNAKGVWVKFEYSQALGPHWRATAAFTLIRGDPTDFLGQYRRNSHAALTLRYSF